MKDVVHGGTDEGHGFDVMTYLTPCLYFMALMSWYMEALMKDHDHYLTPCLYVMALMSWYMAHLKDNDLPDSLLVLHGFDVVVHGSTDDGP